MAFRPPKKSMTQRSRRRNRRSLDTSRVRLPGTPSRSDSTEELLSGRIKARRYAPISWIGVSREESAANPPRFPQRDLRGVICRSSLRRWFVLDLRLRHVSSSAAWIRHRRHRSVRRVLGTLQGTTQHLSPDGTRRGLYLSWQSMSGAPLRDGRIDFCRQIKCH
jgi:hypothetical protein